MSDWMNLDQEYIVGCYGRFPAVLVKGEGARVWDENGKEYLDLGSGIGVNSLGYCDPEWVQAVAGQAAALQHTSNLYYTTPDMGVIYVASQIVTCVFIGIFLAYVYMKTRNIWVAVAVHYMNNNLIPMFVGNYSADVLQGQTIAWGDVLASLILNLVIFGWFIFLKPFREKKEA